MKNHLLKVLSLMALGCSAAYAALVSVPAGDLDLAGGTANWTADNEYILEGITYVKNGTLNIAAGTVIRGQPRSSASAFNPGSLVITKSARINAVGTASNPIIFTTAALAGTGGAPLASAETGYFQRATFTSGVSTTPSNGTFLDANPKNAPLAPTTTAPYNHGQFTGGTTSILAGLAGGIIVLGEAPTNIDNKVSVGGGLFAEGVSFVEGLAEGSDTTYGGTNPNHNQGRLSYISLRHGGARLSADNEINGLTLAGVGSGTQVSHIDVYCNLDDGVEIFGGTVNVSYISAVFCEDDGFDVDEGWTGLAQFVFVMQHPDFGDSLVEADGHNQDNKNGGSGAANHMTENGRPFQNCVIANGTYVGRGSGVRDGFRMRAGFGGHVLNNVIVQANNGVRVDAATGLETDGFDSRTRALLNELRFTNNTLFGNTNNSQTWTKSSGAIQGTWDSATLAFSNSTANPGFKVFNVNVANGVNPVGLQTGRSGSPAAFGTLGALPNHPFFTTATFRGAFPTTKNTTLWTTGWTALNLRGILVSQGNQ